MNFGYLKRIKTIINYFLHFLLKILFFFSPRKFNFLLKNFIKINVNKRVINEIKKKPFGSINSNSKEIITRTNNSVRNINKDTTKFCVNILRSTEIVEIIFEEPFSVNL